MSRHRKRGQFYGERKLKANQGGKAFSLRFEPKKTQIEMIRFEHAHIVCNRLVSLLRCNSLRESKNLRG